MPRLTIVMVNSTVKKVSAAFSLSNAGKKVKLSVVRQNAVLRTCLMQHQEGVNKKRMSGERSWQRTINAMQLVSHVNFPKPSHRKTAHVTTTERSKVSIFDRHFGHQ